MRLVVAAVVVAVLFPAPAVAATRPGANGRIAYAVTVGINTDAYAVRPDGSAARRLTTSPLVDDDPQYSPDGWRITFTRLDLETGATELWTMAADGTGKRRLLADVPGACPRVSPEGRRVAVLRGTRIWVARLDGSGLRQVSHASPPGGPRDTDGCPVWSPDGRWIAYDRVRFAFIPEGELRTASADGRSDRRVLNLGPKLVAGIDWHPDGSRLAFTAIDALGTLDSTLETVRSDGGARTLLDGREGIKRGVAWSPDGSRIAVSHEPLSAADPGMGIYSMRAADGRDRRVLRPGIAPDTLSWQAVPG